MKPAADSIRQWLRGKRSKDEMENENENSHDTSLDIGKPFDVARSDLRAEQDEATGQWKLVRSTQTADSPAFIRASPKSASPLKKEGSPKPAPRGKTAVKRQPPPRPPCPCPRKEKMRLDEEREEVPVIPPRPVACDPLARKSNASASKKLSNDQPDLTPAPVPRPRPKNIPGQEADAPRPTPKARASCHSTAPMPEPRTSVLSSIASSTSRSGSVHSTASAKDREADSVSEHEIEIQTSRRGSEVSAKRQNLPLPPPPDELQQQPVLQCERAESPAYDGGVTQSLYQRLTAIDTILDHSTVLFPILIPDIDLEAETLKKLVLDKDSNPSEMFSENPYSMSCQSVEVTQNDGIERTKQAPLTQRTDTLPKETPTPNKITFEEFEEEESIYAIPDSRKTLSPSPTMALDAGLSSSDFQRFSSPDVDSTSDAKKEVSSVSPALYSAKPGSDDVSGPSTDPILNLLTDRTVDFEEAPPPPPRNPIPPPEFVLFLTPPDAPDLDAAPETSKLPPRLTSDKREDDDPPDTGQNELPILRDHLKPKSYCDNISIYTELPQFQTSGDQGETSQKNSPDYLLIEHF